MLYIYIFTYTPAFLPEEHVIYNIYIYNKSYIIYMSHTIIVAHIVVSTRLPSQSILL